MIRVFKKEVKNLKYRPQRTEIDFSSRLHREFQGIFQMSCILKLYGVNTHMGLFYM